MVHRRDESFGRLRLAHRARAVGGAWRSVLNRNGGPSATIFRCHFDFALHRSHSPEKCTVEVSPTFSCLATKMAIAPHALHLSIEGNLRQSVEPRQPTPFRRPILYSHLTLAFDDWKHISRGIERFAVCRTCPAPHAI